MNSLALQAAASAFQPYHCLRRERPRTNRQRGRDAADRDAAHRRMPQHLSRQRGTRCGFRQHQLVGWVTNNASRPTRRPEPARPPSRPLAPPRPSSFRGRRSKPAPRPTPGSAVPWTNVAGAMRRPWRRVADRRAPARRATWRRHAARPGCPESRSVCFQPFDPQPGPLQQRERRLRTEPRAQYQGRGDVHHRLGRGADHAGSRSPPRPRDNSAGSRASGDRPTRLFPAPAAPSHSISAKIERYDAFAAWLHIGSSNNQHNARPARPGLCRREFSQCARPRASTRLAAKADVRLDRFQIAAMGKNTCKSASKKLPT